LGSNQTTPFLHDDALVHHRFAGIQHNENQIARARHTNNLTTATFTVFGAFDNSGQIQQLNHAKLNSSFVPVLPLRGRVPDYAAPVVVPASKATIEEFCARIHRSLLEQFKHALVWGASVKHGQTTELTGSGTQGGEAVCSGLVR
jgi:ribosome-interacting GTPase 1